MKTLTLAPENAVRRGECAVMRRVLVTSSSLNIATGAVGKEHSEWKTKPCRGPLWSAEEKDARSCKSCASGWTHPNNQPA